MRKNQGSNGRRWKAAKGAHQRGTYSQIPSEAGHFSITFLEIRPKVHRILPTYVEFHLFPSIFRHLIQISSILGGLCHITTRFNIKSSQTPWLHFSICNCSPPNQLIFSDRFHRLFYQCAVIPILLVHSISTLPLILLLPLFYLFRVTHLFSY